MRKLLAPILAAVLLLTLLPAGGVSAAEPTEAVAENLLEGSEHADGKDYLDPQTSATRAQVARILTQFVKNITEA